MKLEDKKRIIRERMPEPIPAETLNTEPVLSQTGQPGFFALIDDLAGKSGPVTFIVGAGLSIDAGFPSWHDMIQSMIGGVTPKETSMVDDDTYKRQVRHLLSIGQEDLMRKADHILGMYRQAHELTVADHLYRNIEETVPGPLSRELAQLVLELQPRSRLMTTNFDDVLEKAFEARGAKTESLSIRDSRVYKREKAYRNLKLSEGFKSIAQELRDIDSLQSTWEAKRDCSSPISILHLHGYIPIEKAPIKTPVILSESEFLADGPIVRKIVTNALMSSTVIFLGVSLTDPNLVGPLWERKKYLEGKWSTDDGLFHAYALTVPEIVTIDQKLRITIETNREYAVERARYLHDTLYTVPLFFKSFSQLQQALRELGLACQLGEHYGDFRYGERMNNALSGLYDRVSGNVDPAEPLRIDPDIHRLKIATLLQEAVAHDADGPLAKMLWYRSPGLLNALRILRGRGCPEEEFRIQIWLRSRTEESTYSYGLNLVADSSLLDVGKSGGYRSVAISPKSEELAAVAAYFGQTKFSNVPATHDVGPRVWRGALATPLWIREEIALRDAVRGESTLMFGVVCLKTTHVLTDDDEGFISRLAPIITRGKLKDLTDLLIHTVDGIIAGARTGVST